MNETTDYWMESLIPSWLYRDPSYLSALRAALIARMAINDFTITEGPFVEDWSDAGQAPLPVGMMLLRCYCTVREFDVIVPMDDEATDPAPAADDVGSSVPRLWVF